MEKLGLFPILKKIRLYLIKRWKIRKFFIRIPKGQKEQEKENIRIKKGKNISGLFS